MTLRTWFINLKLVFIGQSCTVFHLDEIYHKQVNLRHPIPVVSYENCFHQMSFIIFLVFVVNFWVFVNTIFFNNFQAAFRINREAF